MLKGTEQCVSSMAVLEDDTVITQPINENNEKLKDDGPKDEPRKGFFSRKKNEAKGKKTKNEDEEGSFWKGLFDES